MSLSSITTSLMDFLSFSKISLWLMLAGWSEEACSLGLTTFAQVLMLNVGNTTRSHTISLPLLSITSGGEEISWIFCSAQKQILVDLELERPYRHHYLLPKEFNMKHSRALMCSTLVQYMLIGLLSFISTFSWKHKSSTLNHLN